MKDLHIRDATASDYSTFARLFVELAVTDPVPSPERFEREMVPATIIAERDGKAIGYAYYRMLTDTVHLSHLVTSPEARRGGVGRALMSEVGARAVTRGLKTVKLNVKPDNVAAHALYERLGLAVAFTSHALTLAWTVVDGFSSEEAPYVASDVSPGDDERLETGAKLPRGTLAAGRSSGRVIKQIEIASADPPELALGVFDPGFPGIYPMRAPNGALALSLLKAFRPHGEGPVFHVLMEDQAEIAEILMSRGAALKLITHTMIGTLPIA